MSSELDAIFEKSLKAEDLKFVNRVLYGEACDNVEIPAEAVALSEKYDFQIRSFKMTNCKAEQGRAPRRIKVGCIQNSIVAPTSDPIESQRAAIHSKLATMIEAAAACGVNVLGLQECWHMPFAFATREKLPWTDFAEDIETGPSTVFLQELAKKHGMVIVHSLLERDTKRGNILWNSALCIGPGGELIGRARKNHIPRIGDFNESTYYLEGNLGHPVFKTPFGNIGVVVCFARHHPMDWQINALHGADIIFNPSATIGDLSEPLWLIEARCAAIANHVYTVAINRVGTETFPNEFTSGDGKPGHRDFGQFYGSSYVSAPDGSRTPGLSRNRDGLLVTDIDLNLNQQVADRWMFRATGRLPEYVKHLDNAVDVNFDPATKQFPKN